MIQSVRVKQQARSELIEQSVRQFFRRYPSETYMGLKKTSDVVDYVRAVLTVQGFRMTEYVLGDTYDWIRELGPVGEGNCPWLDIWCQGGPECRGDDLEQTA